MGYLLNLTKGIGNPPSPLITGDIDGCDYTQDDVAELHRLACRWHELVWPDSAGTETTLGLLRRMAPVNVVRELGEFRALVAKAEDGR